MTWRIMSVYSAQHLWLMTKPKHEVCFLSVLLAASPSSRSCAPASASLQTSPDSPGAAECRPPRHSGHQTHISLMGVKLSESPHTSAVVHIELRPRPGIHGYFECIDLTYNLKKYMYILKCTFRSIVKHKSKLKCGKSFFQSTSRKFFFHPLESIKLVKIQIAQKK